MTRSNKILLAFLIIVVVGAVTAKIIVSTGITPSLSSEFFASKKQASLTAQELIDISNDSIKNVEQISALNKEYRYNESKQLIQKELDKNNLIKDKATRLSDDLTKMANDASGLKSDASGQLVLQAISTETEVLSHLLTYNDDLNELLMLLQAQVDGQEVNADDIKNLTDKIKVEAQTLIDLNSRFNALMTEFENKQK